MHREPRLSSTVRPHRWWAQECRETSLLSSRSQSTELATAAWPELRDRIPAWLAEPAEADDGAVERATALTNRMLAYVTAAG